MTVTVQAPDEVAAHRGTVVVSGCGFFEPAVDGLIFLRDVAPASVDETNGSAVPAPTPEATTTSVPGMARAFSRVTIDDSQDEPPSPRVLDDDFGF
jgi:hypothetical protein